jgi:hypothetical protein
MGEERLPITEGAWHMTTAAWSKALSTIRSWPASNHGLRPEVSIKGLATGHVRDSPWHEGSFGPRADFLRSIVPFWSFAAAKTHCGYQGRQRSVAPRPNYRFVEISNVPRPQLEQPQIVNSLVVRFLTVKSRSTNEPAATQPEIEMSAP